MKLRELKGIICDADRASIREIGTNGKPEDYMITFSKAVEKYGGYDVWWLEADSQNCFNIIVAEDL